MIKKMLIDGIKIQAKYDGFDDSEVFIEKFEKTLKNEGFDLLKPFSIKYNDGVKDELYLDDIYNYVASKNLPNVYLNENNNIVIEDEYKLSVEFLHQK